MTKTTAPRVRQTNLYTIEQDGLPVAQAMAISQAEAVRLYVESVQQPTMSAHLSSPLEARTLAGLPLLSRGEPVRDTSTPYLFEAGETIERAELLATYCPPVDLPVKTYPPAVLAQIVAELALDHVEDVREMVPPQHAPISAVLEDLASGTSECAETDPLGLDAEAVAIMERLSAVLPAAPAPAEPVETQERRRLFDEAPKGAGKVPVKYRNPATGESWSGRGLRPRWVVLAMDEGKALEDFAV